MMSRPSWLRCLLLVRSARYELRPLCLLAAFPRVRVRRRTPFPSRGCCIPLFCVLNCCCDPFHMICNAFNPAQNHVFIMILEAVALPLDVYNSLLQLPHALLSLPGSGLRGQDSLNGAGELNLGHWQKRLKGVRLGRGGVSKSPETATDSNLTCCYAVGALSPFCCQCLLCRDVPGNSCLPVASNCELISAHLLTSSRSSG